MSSANADRPATRHTLMRPAWLAIAGWAAAMVIAETLAYEFAVNGNWRVLRVRAAVYLSVVATVAISGGILGLTGIRHKLGLPLMLAMLVSLDYMALRLMWSSNSSATMRIWFQWLLMCQTGLLAIWLVMGTTKWLLRACTTIGATTLLVLVYRAGDQIDFVTWATLCGIQAVSIVVSLIVLRSLGVRLLAPSDELPASQGDAAAGQFSLRKLFLWSTLASITLAAWVAIESRVEPRYRIGALCAVAIGLGMTISAAGWLTLGRSWSGIRVGAFAVLCALTGMLVANLGGQPIEECIAWVAGGGLFVCAWLIAPRLWGYRLRWHQIEL